MYSTKSLVYCTRYVLSVRDLGQYGSLVPYRIYFQACIHHPNMRPSENINTIEAMVRKHSSANIRVWLPWYRDRRPSLHTNSLGRTFPVEIP